VVLSQCSFAEHADAVLAELETEHRTAREDIRRRTKERARLLQEVETLKANLALTQKPAQVRTLFELIDARTTRIAELSDAGSAGTHNTLTAAQVTLVRTFLADLRTGWGRQPSALRNEFLRLVVDRVLVSADADHVDVTIVWRGGAEHQLWVERPRMARAGKSPWTPVEDQALWAYYPDATPAEIQAALPRRAYSAIQARASSLGIKRRRTAVTYRWGAPWQDEENAMLRAYMAGQLSYAELCIRLPGRTPEAIQAQRRVLGLTGHPARVYYRVLVPALEMLPMQHHSKMATSPSAARRAASPFPPKSCSSVP
jgi:hypothetical protein